MGKKTIWIIGLVIAIGGVAAMVIFKKADKNPYDTAAVQRGTIVQEVLASGKVESPTKAELQFKNSGKITVLNAVAGQRVAAGDILAKQDASSLESQMRQLQAELQAQEYKLKSRKKNELSSYDDEYDIKAQEAIVNKARADIETQKTKIEETVLRSPISGIIVAVNGVIGEIAKPETVVVSVISDEKLQIDADVSETTVANVQIGQTVRITLDAFEGAEWMGRVAEIDSAETLKGGAVYYKTTVFFDTEDARIRSGMTANIWIKTNISENTLFVPASALQKKDGKTSAQILQSGQPVDKEVITGLKNNAGMVEIVSGLALGEQVVTGKQK